MSWSLPFLRKLVVVPSSIVVVVALGAAACDDQTTPKPLPTTPAADGGASSSGGDGASASGWGDPLEPHKEGMLRIQQFNVRRYFDATCDSGDCTANGFEEVQSPEAFAARTTQIAQGLARVEADVITLAEVENQACLDALQKELKGLGYEYPVAHLAETGTSGSVDVGVLARGKLEKVVTHKKETPLTTADGQKTSFTRELPEVHLTIGTSSVIVFAAHFRSKATDDPARRLAEAVATHQIMVDVGNANTGALVLLGGDLNDSPGSPPIDAMEKDAALVRVAKDIPTDAQGTYTFAGKKEAIDHIFTTAARATNYVPKSATVIRDGSASGTAGFAGSDHASIYADFKLP